MTVRTFIADISEWQPHADLAAYQAGGYQAVICRVAYGTRIDAAMPARRDIARARCRIIGWYLFLRSAEPIDAQIEAFASIIETLGPYEFVALDWERDADGTTPSVAARDETLAKLQARYNRAPWLYGPASALRAAPAPAGIPEWPASYASADPNLAGEKLWQLTDGRYTSAGIPPVNYPGIGLCDGSVFEGSYADLETVITGQPSTNPAPSPAPQMLTDCVAMAPTPSGRGYWLVQGDGGVFTHGDAHFYGSAAGKSAHRVVGIVATPTGGGYALAAADGGVFTFGDAHFDGSEGGKPLAKPVVSIVATPDHRGYWLVAADGGIFTFGDAAFIGSGA